MNLCLSRYIWHDTAQMLGKKKVNGHLSTDVVSSSFHRERRKTWMHICTSEERRTIFIIQMERSVGLPCERWYAEMQDTRKFYHLFVCVPFSSSISVYYWVIRHRVVKIVRHEMIHTLSEFSLHLLFQSFFLSTQERRERVVNFSISAISIILCVIHPSCLSLCKLFVGLYASKIASLFLPSSSSRCEKRRTLLVRRRTTHYSISTQHKTGNSIPFLSSLPFSIFHSHMSDACWYIPYGWTGRHLDNHTLD